MIQLPDQRHAAMTSSESAEIAHRLHQILGQMRAAQRVPACLVLVSKTRPSGDLRSAFAAGARAFGENYVQEALSKQAELRDLPIEWHLIGPLQSNKCLQVAASFDWLQSLDRLKLVPLLAQARPPHLPPLQVLIQVNIDDEASKSGCAVEQMWALADAVLTQPRLCLRGLMAIPKPGGGESAFATMAQLFSQMQAYCADNPSAMIDTLSMGMSDDFAAALAHGATMIRVGSAIFGARV